MALTQRSLTVDEQPDALALWYTVFEWTPPGYFERYFASDPWHKPGDTLGVWDDGKLVSAVHLCRRPVAWQGGSLLCGAIANVATLEESRRQGLSRRLLDALLAKMTDENFDFSLLGTGVPDHYAALGWETIQTPKVTLGTPPVAAMLPDEPPTPTAQHHALYAQSPRLVQFERPEPYFTGWNGWVWNQPVHRLRTLPGNGYVLFEPSDEANRPGKVLEWRASDAASELALFAQAASLPGQGVELPTLPQWVSLDDLGGYAPTIERDFRGTMLRNLHLPDAEYARVKAAYESGASVWWETDGF